MIAYVEYTIDQPEASVTINCETTYHATFDDAWREVTPHKPATITLMSDCVDETNLEIYGRNVTLDTAQYFLYVDNVYVYNSKLTIKGNGVIAGNSEEKAYLVVAAGSELVIESGTFDGEVQCYANKVDEKDSKITINGGTIHELVVNDSSDTCSASEIVNDCTITGEYVSVFYDRMLILNKCTFTDKLILWTAYSNELDLADINGDGKVNTIDVAQMNSHAKGVTELW